GLALLKINVPIDYENPDIIFYFDDDGDRIAVGEPNRGKIRGDLLLGLLASYYFAGKKVVYDVKVAQSIVDYLSNEKKCEMIRSKTGHGFIKPAMIKNDAPFGGEYSGHIMYKSMGFVESPGLTMISILYLIGQLGKSISELVLPMQGWEHSGEFEFDLTMLADPKELILDKLKNKYSESDINTLDGVDIHNKDWRMLVRPSGTHHALICIVEGSTTEIMQARKQELLELLGATEDMMTKWG
ncbi:MAG: hypothetical protein Q7R33_02555, partial [Nitrosarchaeum sp.]|nr:hypothetical protein [Nitrosarchaeum sp.]